MVSLQDLAGEVEVVDGTGAVGIIHDDGLAEAGCLAQGMKVDKKKALPKVDGVTGATFTSDAMREHVNRAIAYYQKHK